jgi:heme-degrading monooxygenase HmoA
VTTHASLRQIRRQRIQGALIGGVFGFVFLVANARTPLGQAAADLFRALAILGLILLLIGRRRALHRRAVSEASRAEQIDLFGRRWRLIVAAEVAALTAGFIVIWQIGAPSETYLPWTVFVVGLHFIAFRFAGVWQGRIAETAGILTALGIAGLALAATAETDWIPFVSGVLAGITLLGGSLTAMRRAISTTGMPAENRRTPMPGPFVLINAFEVAQEADEEFLRGWTATRDFLERQPGYVETTLHRAVSPRAEFRFVNIARWDSPEHFQQAVQSDGFREKAAALAGFPSHPGLYQVAPG